MRESIGGSFLFLRKRKGSGAYECDVKMVDKHRGKSKIRANQRRKSICQRKKY